MRERPVKDTPLAQAGKQYSKMYFETHRASRKVTSLSNQSEMIETSRSQMKLTEYDMSQIGQSLLKLAQQVTRHSQL